VQVELSGVRILFELLGFLLSVENFPAEAASLTCQAMSVYNGDGVNFLRHD